MDIQTKKLGLIEWITRLSDKSLIDELKTMMDSHQNAKGISDAEKESVLKGVSDFEKGKIHSHEEVRNIYEKYL
jgi:hypothetical protein